LWPARPDLAVLVAAELELLLARDQLRQHIRASWNDLPAVYNDWLLEFCQAGCTRAGTTATAAILDEWKARLAPVTPQAPQQPTASA